MRSLLCLSLVGAAVCPGQLAHAKRPIVAVFNIDGTGSRQRPALLARYSAYLTAQLAATGAFRVTPHSKLRQVLRQQKLRSYRNCYDESCQIEIGRELAAQQVLSTKVLRFGRRCVVSSVLSDLRTQVHVASASVKGRCSEEGIADSIDKVVVRLAGGRGSSAAPAGSGAGRPVALALYMMSRCPYAAKLIGPLQRVVRRLGARVQLSVDYILSEKNGRLSSMYRQADIEGDALQLCARRHTSDPATQLSFIACMAGSLATLPAGWQRCARQAGLPVRPIQRCARGSRGRRLLRASVRRSRAAGVRGSPTLRIAGADYRGSRSETGLLRALCAASTAPRPAACASLPALVPVTATVLGDRRCTDKRCNVDGMLDKLRQRFFPQITVRRLDYSSSEGRRLYHKLKLSQLPAVLFHRGVERAENYPSIRRWLKPRGAYLLLRTPGGVDPTAEICDNRKDDTGNGKVDCADPTCRNKLLCRPARFRELQLFIMSRCPYAARAVRALGRLLPRFNGQLTVRVHYIASRADQRELGFTSLHGDDEVREDLRQVCAIHHYRQDHQFMDYLTCRAADVKDKRWRRCARGGISAAVIQRCAEGPEGRRLLQADIRHAKALGIAGSPSWLINNQHKFAGLKQEQILPQICRRNPNLPGCRR